MLDGPADLDRDAQALASSMAVLGRMLVVGLEPIVYPDYLDRLREQVLVSTHKWGLDRVALACERVTSIDARSIAAINRIFSAVKLLGASGYLVGLPPLVAATIVGIEQEIVGATEVKNLEQALSLRLSHVPGENR